MKAIEQYYTEMDAQLTTVVGRLVKFFQVMAPPTSEVPKAIPESFAAKIRVLQVVVHDQRRSQLLMHLRAAEVAYKAYAENPLLWDPKQENLVRQGMLAMRSFVGHQ